jgi:hypothetical protein
MDMQMHHQIRKNNIAAEKREDEKKEHGYRSVVYVPRRSQILPPLSLSHLLDLL